ncbi:MULTISPECIES: hypothetical protein [Tatumella]|uniref:DUF2570 domain-containing protein n=1 Tax=Tatumella punctata TaxID=399969 RepID=A0ABW1VHU8_9GAMM|nr:MULTISPECIES: hypothetical protein [unclassified Tatumella]MBS0855432.1 hypothetical protein [Tatumella sp. JGM16]MBS0877196.1 hypothetical protein [Tatumella sp. JGM82]MBS0889435.1 hypothetical protein [Tatumella sp. JGM94]MBS0901593.1 hypothetical protein [Tatumella sp. JGM100]MBS0911666.1 hypothetical protein [Tatumella sp. JGM91]
MNIKSLLITLAMLIWLSSLILTGVVSWRYKTALVAQQQAEQQQQQQAAIITHQQQQWLQTNRLSQQVLAANTRSREQTEEKLNEYRKILRNRQSCNQPVPDDIAQRLYRYAQSLRTRAMYTAAGSTATAGSRAITPGQLTYCQAVLWIDPLLHALETANNQLIAISGIEQSRAGKTGRSQ